MKVTTAKNRRVSDGWGAGTVMWPCFSTVEKCGSVFCQVADCVLSPVT